MSHVARTLLALLVLVSAGCASRGPMTASAPSSPRCDARWNLADAGVLGLDAPHAEELRFDADSACSLDARGAAVRYTLLRLPRYRQDWMLNLESVISGPELFAPEVLTLDAQGQVLRQLSFDRFSLRGDRLQASLFFAQGNAAERFLLVRAALPAVGRQGTRVVASTFALPILTGLMPMVYLQGTEHEQHYTFAQSGVMQLQARSALAMRRLPRVNDVARGEMGFMP